MQDRVHFGVDREIQLHVAVVIPLFLVGEISREAVETLAHYGEVGTNYHRAALGAGVFGPVGNFFGDLQEPLVPLLAPAIHRFTERYETPEPARKKL
jgi:hypothetical protein